MRLSREKAEAAVSAERRGMERTKRRVGTCQLHHIDDTVRVEF